MINLYFQLDECACLKTDSRLLFQAEFLCDTPCKGDGNVDCGGNGGWSLYQKGIKPAK